MVNVSLKDNRTLITLMEQIFADLICVNRLFLRMPAEGVVICVPFSLINSQQNIKP